MTGLLKIAVPNKGALSDAANRMLLEAGYLQRTDSKDLVLLDEANGVEFYYLRPRDIAVYVGEGTLDLGITGRDMLIDSHASATEIMALGFGSSKFRFAAVGAKDWTVADLAGKRIATSYPGVLRGYLAEHGVEARLIKLDGAVESSIRLGVADAVADVVETGTTLKRAGLQLFGEPIMRSEAILIQRRDADAPAGLAQLRRRLEGVLVARNYVLIDYDVAEDDLESTCALAPGLEGATVSPLAREGWVAVRVLAPRKGSQALMDRLWDAGARAILVTDLAACRL
ncbi:MAG: ATP phosphoribosyltransferase [Propionibacterium sp.]|nr:MAG: ATP phosphoribosyltransferase [Propionibacterium sp.]